jgi:hypothetical protein
LLRVHPSPAIDRSRTLGVPNKKEIIRNLDTALYNYVRFTYGPAQNDYNTWPGKECIYLFESARI